MNLDNKAGSQLYQKWIRVDEFQALLKDLPGCWSLVPNAIGNIAINDHNGNCVGHIDILEQSIELWGDAKEEVKNG
jgi:hypothetical protein